MKTRLYISICHECLGHWSDSHLKTEKNWKFGNNKTLWIGSLHPFPPFWGSTWISTPWQWRFLTVRKRLWWDPNFNVHISFRSASIPSTNGHLYVIPSFFQSSTPRKKRASIYLWLYHRFPPPKITALKHFFHPLRRLPKKRYNNQQTPSHPTPTPDKNT